MKSILHNMVLKATQLFLVFMILSGSAQLYGQVIRYVKPVASGSGNGSSWANASANLQAMINASAAGNEVWVAAGTYKPTTGSDRTISFKMKNGVGIYGGFIGNETDRNQRDFTNNLTTLSGDLDDDDYIAGSGESLSISANDENSYVVVANEFTLANPLTTSAVLDGFTIRGGRNQTSTMGPYNAGAGMRNFYSSPTLNNIIFIGNRGFNGGGMFNSLNSSPVLTDVKFQQNISEQDGGGMHNYENANVVLNNVAFIGNRSYGSFGGGGVANFNNSPTFNNCEFTDNYGTYTGAVFNVGVNSTFSNCSFTNSGAFYSAGGMWVENSTVNFYNCLFSGNNANLLHAGAIWVRSATVNATNCVFWDNSAAPYNQSSVMYIDGTNPLVTIKNSIIWNNQSLFYGVQPTITYSIVQGGYTGTGNLNTDPLFANPSDPIGADGAWATADDGFRLQLCSPGVNTGDNAGVTTTDFAGSGRIFNTTVDLGAYELQVLVTNTTFYQDLDGDGFGNTEVTILACSAPSGYVADNTDCNDNNPLEKPGQVWYKDSDNDGYGETGAATITQCFRPEGYKAAIELIAITGDCDDNDPNVNIPPGDPNVFGSNTWIVYAWDAGSANGDNPDNWNINYSGFYTSSSLNLYSDDDWNHLTSPSYAANYQGCPVGIDNHSWSAKRKGFPTTYYYLSVDFHDDAAQLWINGTKAWEHNGCCDAHPNVWSGDLGPNDEVEFRVSEGGGGSVGQLSFAPCPAGNIMYVNHDASGSNDGTSWANAFNDLQDALAMADLCPSVSEIWVAAGTYKPTTGTDRTISFMMKNDLAIYGGFNGTETLLNHRDYSSNITILSGDLNGDDVVHSANNIQNNGENSYQVVANRFTVDSPLLASAVLDGFTITGGRNLEQLYGLYSTGGGMYNLFASPTLNNIVFFGNRAQNGGGGLMNSLNCSPTLTNVTFDRNFSQNNGGGLYNFEGANTVLNDVTFIGNFCYGSFGGGGVANFNNSPTFNNCEFSDNFASSSGAVFNIGVNSTFTNCSFTNNGVFQSAGCMYVENSSVNLYNCLFSGNTASSLYAGAIYVNSAGTVNATNCVFYGNSAGNSNPYNQSGVMMLTGTNPAATIKNSIIWGNQSLFLGVQPTITYSIIEGGYSGTGNLNADPLFVDAANGNLRLQTCSPAIDAGSNAAVPGGLITDLDGNPRFFNEIVDMGAYEAQPTYPGDPSVFGNNVWNVYVWNAGGANFSGNAWNLNYSGNYVETNLNINTETRWNAFGAPSEASGYMGCVVGVDNHSYSYKRIGFPQDYYSLSVDHHDDAAQLWINGTKVWEHDGCCDAHPDVWSGGLGPNDEVEFRVTEGGGVSAARLSFAPCPTGNILYVNDDASGSNDGTSWVNAFNDLQDALALAGFCTNVSEIWVAAGTYKPTTGTDRNISFVMNNGVAIYGGFNGTETQLLARDWVSNETILSGDIGAQGDNSDNSCTVVKGSATNSTAVIDGFTITLGNADVTTGDNSNPDRSGGGMYNNNGSPTVTNCTFSGNTANSFGGGMFNHTGSSPTITNSSFSGNWAGLSGGGMYNFDASSPTVTNSSFSGNSANNFGGGMYNGDNSSPTITNCILWGNSTAIYNSNSAPIVSFSIVQGGYAGTGNLDVDPLFVDQPPVGLGTVGNLRLQACSPAINAGNNAANSTTADLDGNPRIFATTIDMGAYEAQCTNPMNGGEIDSSQTICSGTSPEPFYNVSAPACFVGDIEFQWQISTSGLTYDDIDGAVNETYTHAGLLTQTTWFRRLVKVECETVWVESDTIQISVNPLPVINAGTFESLCNDDEPIELIGEPAGGIWTGTGVSGDGPYFFNPAAGSQTITYTYTNQYGCSASDEALIMVEACDPDDLELPSLVVNAEDELCFGATNSIIVQNGLEVFSGSITLIAGESIHLMPGVIVQGGYLHAYISNTPCDNPENLLNTVRVESMISTEDGLIGNNDSFFKIYPNPTTGSFTLELTGAKDETEIAVEIYNSIGERLLSSKLHGSFKYEFHLGSYKNGIYFVRVFDGDKIEMQKVIKK